MFEITQLILHTPLSGDWLSCCWVQQVMHFYNQTAFNDSRFYSKNTKYQVNNRPWGRFFYQSLLIILIHVTKYSSYSIPASTNTALAWEKLIYFHPEHFRFRYSLCLDNGSVFIQVTAWHQRCDKTLPVLSRAHSFICPLQAAAS